MASNSIEQFEHGSRMWQMTDTQTKIMLICRIALQEQLQMQMD